MALSAFDDKSLKPATTALRRVLGTAAPHWRALLSQMKKRHGPLAEEWNFAGAKYGWSLRLKQGERNILYLTPQAGAFRVGVVLGGAAVDASRQAELPDDVRELIDAAPQYAEGRGIRFTVTNADGVRTALLLSDLKMTPTAPKNARSRSRR